MQQSLRRKRICVGVSSPSLSTLSLSSYFSLFRPAAGCLHSPRQAASAGRPGLFGEYWSSTSPGHFAPKGATGGVAAPVAHAGAVPAVVSELFSMFDRDGDGKITKQELELLERSDPPSEEEVAMMVVEVDRDGDRCISLDEFRALGPSPAWGTSGGTPGVEELWDAFAIFDADGNGKISAEELLRIFVTLMHALAEEEESDDDEDGCLAQHVRRERDEGGCSVPFGGLLAGESEPIGRTVEEVKWADDGCGF
ncbi:hypothetical protein Taro_038052 [Colocasia esculenta]|uniref:EF-hand domain-containing protein n=1 Tax=Colocasia esculenta TaxID=4460 RepID=A0A843WMJ0_COLES|nr:hypothetical protein [Colocasia esculenta]